VKYSCSNPIPVYPNLYPESNDCTKVLVVSREKSIKKVKKRIDAKASQEPKFLYNPAFKQRNRK
jgi:hypothetical protein